MGRRLRLIPKNNSWQNQLQTFANWDSGAVSNPHVWPTLYWMTGCQWWLELTAISYLNAVSLRQKNLFWRNWNSQQHRFWQLFLLQQRRWDRPLGTAHFATVKCQLIQQFATIQVTKFAIPSVRWMQRFSSLWPDLVDIRRIAIT